jgi:uncharacterized protein YjhX (UPF0386 family)
MGFEALFHTSVKARGLHANKASAGQITATKHRAAAIEQVMCRTRSKNTQIA